uniref:Uncharacterized protein n=1 Tax=Romanomermis culicivorax TaxID=13658 RepID=A0A915IAN5_ROMCU
MKLSIDFSSGNAKMSITTSTIFSVLYGKCPQGFMHAKTSIWRKNSARKTLSEMKIILMERVSPLQK